MLIPHWIGNANMCRKIAENSGAVGCVFHFIAAICSSVANARPMKKPGKPGFFAQRLNTDYFPFWCPCLCFKSEAATSFSCFVLFGFCRIFPASLAAFLPVDITELQKVAVATTIR